MKNKILFGIASGVTCVVTFYVVLWIALFKENTGTREDLLALYQTYYPGFSPLVGTLIFIFLCAASLFCFERVNKNAKGKSMRFSSSLMMAVNLILIAWFLFSMM